MSQIIVILVIKVMSHKGDFRLASEKTALGDENIKFRFGGDKGSTQMAFKFGSTVMNCMKPNHMEAFNLISTMEAYNAYYILKHGMFKNYKAELDFVLNVEKDPHFFVICDKVGFPLLSRTSEAAILNNLLTCDPVEHMFDDHVQCNVWIREKDFLCICVDDEQCWGIGVVATSGKIVSSVDFAHQIQIRDLHNLSVRQFILHCMLGGDIEFFVQCRGTVLIGPWVLMFMP
jgi:hypothetical protein